MESKQEESDDHLHSLLQSHRVPSKYYTKLIDEGLGSIELLSQCTQNDVEQLCTQLALTLVDKLKLKQALKSVNIPAEEIKYAVINKDEESAIIDINHSIKKVEKLIIENNTNIAYSNELQNKLRSDKKKICSVFDSIHEMMNQRKENILNDLEKHFEEQHIRNQELLKYLDKAKTTKTQCQQLVLKKNHLARNHTITDLRNECLSNLKNILQTNTNINVMINNNEIQSIKQMIYNVVTIDNNKENKERIKEYGAISFERNPDANNDDRKHDKERNLNNNDDANHTAVTFKPLIELCEQDVESGHEKEELIGRVKVVKVYNFGVDGLGQQSWKMRAAQTELQFYRNNQVNKARLVCRESQTAKLRLNHFVPSPNIAKLNCKSDKVVIWAAYDVTIESNNALSTFCAKFADAQSAAQFRSYFEKCQGL